MRKIVWSIKEVVEILKARQGNEFDGNIAVSGDRGNGKSTVINKILLRFDNFNPWTHQVYSRKEVVNLLKTQFLGICWDDEAINSGYKRNFQNKGQHELIKLLTAYRDNFNVFASAIPNFFSLDRDLRDLYFLHLHVIERGIAVVHMPIQGKIYSQDRWDAKYNAKIEERFGKKIKEKPDYTPPYHKLTTFRGYLYFSDLTTKQKELYKLVKRTKREQAFSTPEELEEDKEKSFNERIYELLLDYKLSRDGLIQICLANGKKYSNTVSSLNIMLKDNGDTRTVGQLLTTKPQQFVNSKLKAQINELLPELT